MKEGMKKDGQCPAPAIINNLNPIFILQIYEMLAIFFAVQNCMQHIPECILAKNGDYRASLDQRRKIRTYLDNKRKLVDA